MQMLVPKSKNYLHEADTPKVRAGCTSSNQQTVVAERQLWPQVLPCCQVFTSQRTFKCLSKPNVSGPYKPGTSESPERPPTKTISITLAVSTWASPGLEEDPLLVSGIFPTPFQVPSNYQCATPTMSESDYHHEIQEHHKRFDAVEDRLDHKISYKSHHGSRSVYCKSLCSKVKNLSNAW